eukprot:2568268-Amphidinium_carterae.3
MISQEQAVQVGQMAVAGPTQVFVTNGAIAIVNAASASAASASSSTQESSAAAASSYTQRSEVVVRRKCGLCKVSDASGYPLKVCWIEG